MRERTDVWQQRAHAAHMTTEPFLDAGSGEIRLRATLVLAGGLCRMGHQPDPTSHSWLARFCTCLMQLQPHLSFVRAVQHAVAIYCYAKELPPERAAAISARECATRGTAPRGNDLVTAGPSAGAR